MFPSSSSTSSSSDSLSLRRLFLLAASAFLLALSMLAASAFLLSIALILGCGCRSRPTSACAAGRSGEGLRGQGENTTQRRQP
eukprot:271049-Prorocentrum_minimum.AAC.1